ncbi:endonuclease domain-containing protein [Streptosporangium roseum]|uniref:endonuclease domain-containing protein n=1 Tax=Streptosporangium roseum TaxID=2001 RepID=UPI003327ABC0
MEVGFYDSPEGRMCRKCVSLASVKGNLRRYYNLTLDDVQSMCDRQNNQCGTCGLDFKEYNLSCTDTHMGYLNADHCHAAGRVRGLLCMSCNLALGMVNDDTVVLQQMVRRLEDHASFLDEKNQR